MDKSNFAARMPGSLPQPTAVVSTNLTGGGKINGSYHLYRCSSGFLLQI